MESASPAVLGESVLEVTGAAYTRQHVPRWLSLWGCRVGRLGWLDTTVVAMWLPTWTAATTIPIGSQEVSRLVPADSAQPSSRSAERERAHDPNILSVELEPKLEAGSDARKVIRAAFRQVPERVMGDLLLVVTELVTNAVRHGPGRPIGLTVALDRRLDVIRGEVVDQGDPSESIPRIAEVTKDKGGGYGLRLVNALTSTWYVVEGSTSVHFEMPLESA